MEDVRVFDILLLVLSLSPHPHFALGLFLVFKTPSVFFFFFYLLKSLPQSLVIRTPSFPSNTRTHPNQTRNKPKPRRRRRRNKKMSRAIVHDFFGIEKQNSSKLPSASHLERRRSFKGTRFFSTDFSISFRFGSRPLLRFLRCEPFVRPSECDLEARSAGAEDGDRFQSGKWRPRRQIDRYRRIAEAGTCFRCEESVSFFVVAVSVVFAGSQSRFQVTLRPDL